MKKLLKYLKSYKKESILCPFFKLIEAFFDLIVPVIVGRIIDYGIGENNSTYIVKMVILLVAIAVGVLFFAITAQYFAAKASVGFVTDVRSALFAHISSLSYSNLDKIGYSSLITRMTSDINQLQQGVNMTLRLLLRAPIIVIGSIVMSFVINREISLVFLLTTVVLTIIVAAIMIFTMPMYKKNQENLDNITDLTRENLAGARVVRAFCMEESEDKKFKIKNDILTKSQKFAGYISSLLNPATFIVINLGVIALIHFGAVEVNSGSLTQGSVVSLYNYMAQILTELIKCIDFIIVVNRAVACGNRVQDILDIAPDQKFSSELKENENSEYAVEFKNVTMKYHSTGESALENISFKVRKGETVGIIGATGSGKTTLVNLIDRFYDCTVGEVLVDGINVKDYPEKQLKEKIGIVPQKATLFSGTIRSNLLWGNSNASDDALIDAVKTAQAYDVILKKNGLDSVVEQEGRNFSGGQKQRLTIARALVKKPEILIMDDSASALDLKTDRDLRKAIAENGNHSTVFIVSQRTASVMNSDIIIVLDDGKAVGIGTHKDLMKNCNVYKEIYLSQFGGQEK